MSNQTYRQQQLDLAKAKREQALAALSAAKTATAKRDATEDVEFWRAKVAFLENLRMGAFEDERA